MPSDRAPGPDGFNGLFYKFAWPIIKIDVRSFHLLIDALMILLRKNPAPSRLKDFRPIALMHSFSKLFAKCLARRLAQRLKDMVALNQSAFIRVERSTITSRPSSLRAGGYTPKISRLCCSRWTLPKPSTRSPGRS